MPHVKINHPNSLTTTIFIKIVTVNIMLLPGGVVMTGVEWNEKEERLFRFLRTTTIRDSIKKIRIFLLLRNCSDGRMLLAKKEINGTYTLPYKEVETSSECDIGEAIMELCREKASIGVIEQLKYLGKLILKNGNENQNGGRHSNGNGHHTDGNGKHNVKYESDNIRGLVFSACTRISDEKQIVPNAAIWTTIENSKNYHTDDVVFEAVKREIEMGKKE